MTKSTKTAQTKAEKQEKTIDVNALLKAQEEKFSNLIAELNDRNKELAQELTNLKSNTEEENALLGQKIADIKGEEVKPVLDPYEECRLYKVYNSVAKITTIMTGDEVRGIIGSIDRHLTKKLRQGELEVEKHPYRITFYTKV